MRQYYSVKTEQCLRNYWELAYEHGEVLIDIPNSENPIMIKVVLNQLQNYRRHVRWLKLNPLYKDQWNRINKCKLLIPRAGDLTIRIVRKIPIAYTKKIRFEYRKHPFNKFDIPRGVESGTN